MLPSISSRRPCLLTLNGEAIGDGFTGHSPGVLEQQVLAAIHAAGVAARTNVRSFDHRCVLLLRQLEPRLTGAVLLESLWLRRFDLPAGSSLLGVARKPAAPAPRT